MAEKFKIYRLTNGKSQGGWQLPLTDVLLEKVIEKINDKGEKEISKELRKIKYVPGTHSIWAEDLSGELKPMQIWFEDGKCIVPIVDKNKIFILENHPWNKKHYELFDKDAEAKRELEALKFKGEVRSLIEASDIEVQKAICIGVFGLEALTWGESTCELELRRMAESDPMKLKSQLNSKDYQGKYLAALAYAKDIVKDDMGRTSVIWNDTTKGVITPIARGENGINVLAEFLSTRTDQSLLVLQSISDKIKKSEINIETENSSEKDEALKAKDREIEELRKQLAAKNADDNLTEQEELIPVRAKYEDLIGPVPVNMKNNLEWLTEKINAKLAEQ